VEWQWLYSPTHCAVIFDPLVDQIGVGVHPKCSKSYYWTVDVADTLLGPQAITKNPIYEGAHLFRLNAEGDGVINFYVSEENCCLSR